MTCIIKPDMHHTCLRIVPCLVVVVYYVVCFFPVLLLWFGSDNVAFVRTRSTTSVFLLHGLVLLPCGISGKMTIPSKSLLSLLAISKPCIRFRRSLYRFQPKSPHLSSGTLVFPGWGQVLSFLCKSCICITYRIPHIVPCSCVGYLLCCVWFFLVLLLRVGSINVAFVRTRSTTSVCLLRGLILLPCGISGKMTIPSKSLLSLLA